MFFACFVKIDILCIWLYSYIQACLGHGVPRDPILYCGVLGYIGILYICIYIYTIPITQKPIINDFNKSLIASGIGEKLAISKMYLLRFGLQYHDIGVPKGPLTYKAVLPNGLLVFK